MLYHKDVFLPRRIKGMVPAGVKSLRYTLHAGRELNHEGIYHPPMVVDLGAVEVVEVSVAYDAVDKVIVRMPCEVKPDCDYVLALIPTEDKKTWLVKTGWLNNRNDNHRTLDSRPYVCRQK